jgi:hypothetical protein
VATSIVNDLDEEKGGREASLRNFVRAWTSYSALRHDEERAILRVPS